MRATFKPVLIGAAAYLPLYGLLWLIYQMPMSIFQNHWVQLLATLYGVIMLPACGYVAARFARQHGLFIGSLCGSVIAFATVIISASFIGQDWYGESLLTTTLSFVIKYGFYAALGGAVGELHARKGFAA